MYIAMDFGLNAVLYTRSCIIMPWWAEPHKHTAVVVMCVCGVCYSFAHFFSAQTVIIMFMHACSCTQCYTFLFAFRQDV